jgi:hypothetical protein
LAQRQAGEQDTTQCVSWPTCKQEQSTLSTPPTSTRTIGSGQDHLHSKCESPTAAASIRSASIEACARLALAKGQRVPLHLRRVGPDGRGLAMDRMMRVEVTLSAKAAGRLCLLADELATF